MVSSKLATIVFIFAVCIGLAFSQGEECGDGVQTCTSTFMTSFQAHMTNLDMVCGDLQTFVNCIFSLNCPITEDQKQNLINQMVSNMRDQGLNCDISVDGVSIGTGDSGGSTGTGSEGGDGMDMGNVPGLPQECQDSINGCTQIMMQAIQDMTNDMQNGVPPSIATFCPKVKNYQMCIKNVNCPLSTQQREEISNKIVTQTAQYGLNCADVGGDGSGTGSGTNVEGGSEGTSGMGSGASMMDFARVIALFAKHQCPSAPSECSQQYNIQGTETSSTNSQICSDVRKSGKCMFDKCDAIKGSEDGDQAATLLVKFAKNEFQCEISSSEIQGNGQVTVHQPVFLSVLIAAAATLMKKLFC